MQYSYGKNIALSLTAVFLSAQIALASVTIIPAQGGNSLPADSVAGIWTSLNGPTLIERATGDIGVGTIVFQAPAGFVFDTSGVPASVLIMRNSGTGPDFLNINGAQERAALPVTSITSSEVTFTVVKSSDAGVKDSLIWQNLRVRPTSFSPLASGSLAKEGSAVLHGISIPSSYGLLQEIPAHDLQPVVLHVSSSFPDGVYQSGEQIPLLVTFNQSVKVTGTPRLRFMVGKNTRDVDYLSGSGTNELTFLYKVLPTDKSTGLDYDSSHALVLGGGAIKDAATDRIDAILTLPTPGSAGSLSADRNIVLNTSPANGSNFHSGGGVVLGVSTSRFSQEMNRMVEILLPDLVHVILLH